MGRKISKDPYSSGPRLKDNEVQTDSIIKRKESFNPQHHTEKSNEKTDASLANMKQRKNKCACTPVKIRQVNRNRKYNRHDVKNRERKRSRLSNWRQRSVEGVRTRGTKEQYKNPNMSGQTRKSRRRRIFL